VNDYSKRLDERIRQLKADTLARNSWRRLRIEIERRGGRWRAENGLTFELRDGVIYQYLGDYKEGVSNLIITSLDAPVPYVATLAIDLQGTPPSKRKALLKELEETAAKTKGPPAEIVVIVEHDWLTKISKARWGTMQWGRHLKPTSATLDARKKRGVPFNPDEILPGDTFEVTA
jgi:hypothetical protein